MYQFGGCKADEERVQIAEDYLLTNAGIAMITYNQFQGIK